MFRSGRIDLYLTLLISSEIELSRSMVRAMSPPLILSHRLQIPHLDRAREGRKTWL
jgi:hypothetical protein